MNYRGITSLLVAALFGLACPLSNAAFAEDLQAIAHPEQLGFDADRLERVTNAFQGYVDEGRLPGAVLLIARDGKVGYLQAFGYQDREKKIAMRPDSVFRIASMTKPIVSVAAMMLVEEGKLDLAAPVSQYLPEFKDIKVGVEKPDTNTGKAELVLEPQKRPMTVQDLMRHTAGLVYGQFGDAWIHKEYRAQNMMDWGQSLPEMITKLSRLPLAHQPGEVWEYSMATDVLGRVVEVVSGTTLDAFIEERITKPLNMTSTAFWVRSIDQDRVAEPQVDPTTGKRPPMPNLTAKPRWLSGGAGLVSTAADYLSFTNMLLNGGTGPDARLLSSATVRLMTADSLPPGLGYSERALTSMADLAPTPAAGQGFGLGFAVRTAAGRNPLPGSVGTYYWTAAFGPTFWVDPTERLIGIMMIQVPFADTGPYRRTIRYLAYQALLDRVE